MKKKLLCLSAILAMTSTTMVSFANEVTNYISLLFKRGELYFERK